MAKASKKSEPAVHHFKSVHVQHLPPAVDLVVGSPVIGGAIEAPPATALAKTRNTYKQDFAAKVMKQIWPEGLPKDKSTSDIRKKIITELGRQSRPAKEIPSRATIERVLGRRK
jgi:hypothetical protein